MESPLLISVISLNLTLYHILCSLLSALGSHVSSGLKRGQQASGQFPIVPPFPGIISLLTSDRDTLLRPLKLKTHLFALTLYPHLSFQTSGRSASVSMALLTLVLIVHVYPAGENSTNRLQTFGYWLHFSHPLLFLCLCPKSCQAVQAPLPLSLSLSLLSASPSSSLAFMLLCAGPSAILGPPLALGDSSSRLSGSSSPGDSTSVVQVHSSQELAQSSAHTDYNELVHAQFTI